MAKKANSIAFSITDGGQARYLTLPQIKDTGGTGQVRDIDSTYWFSALQPVKPVAPPGFRVRQWGFQPGANIVWTPGSADTPSAGFEILRQVADNWDLLRLVLETVKDRLCALKWEIRVKKQPGEKNKDAKTRTQSDPRVGKLITFFEKPDGDHNWDEWLRMWLEDVLVLDAGALYLERDLRGRIASLRPIDGATINRVITDQGFTPAGPGDVAYQQVLYGLPTKDLTVDDLIYIMRNPRTWKRYGFGPVEQMLVTIATGLARQKFTLNYYTEGNVPEGLVFLPSTVPVNQVLEVQQWFDSVLSGDLQRRRRINFLPGFGDKDHAPNIVFPKEPLLKGEMDDWLFRIICFNLGISPQQMMKMMNRATAEQSQENAEEEGLEPKAATVEHVINNVIQNKMGFDDLEFSYSQRRETDVLKQMQVDTGYLKVGVRTINETRENLGEDPRPEAEADELGVLTQNGFLPLTGGVIGAPGSGSDPIPQPDNAKGAAGAEGEDDGPGGKTGKEPTKPKKPGAKDNQANGKAKVWGHCDNHEDYDHGCLACAKAELHRVIKVATGRTRRPDPVYGRVPN